MTKLSTLFVQCIKLGVCHRDIAPRNIICSPPSSTNPEEQERFTIIDFAYACSLQEGQEEYNHEYIAIRREGFNLCSEVFVEGCVGAVKAGDWLAGMFEIKNEKEDYTYTSDPIWRELLRGMDYRRDYGEEEELENDLEWRPWSEVDLKTFREWDEKCYEDWKNIQKEERDRDSNSLETG